MPQPSDDRPTAWHRSTYATYGLTRYFHKADLPELPLHVLRALARVLAVDASTNLDAWALLVEVEAELVQREVST
jgi:hypothetical protein